MYQSGNQKVPKWQPEGPPWYFLVILWYLLVTPLVPSGFPFGTFCLSLWYLLVFHLVSSTCPFGSFWFSIWYLLPIPLVPSDYCLIPSDKTLLPSGCHFGTFWLPLWYILTTLSDLLITLWYFPLTQLVPCAYQQKVPQGQPEGAKE
jgi:hypothetical protein